MSIFKIGDLVTLKSGSPKMTVIGYTDKIVDVMYFHDSKFEKFSLDKNVFDLVKILNKEVVSEKIEEPKKDIEKIISKIFTKDGILLPIEDEIPEEIEKKFLERVNSINNLGLVENPLIGKEYKDKKTGFKVKIVNVVDEYIYFDTKNKTSFFPFRSSRFYRIGKSNLSKYYELVNNNTEKDLDTHSVKMDYFKEMDNNRLNYFYEKIMTKSTNDIDSLHFPGYEDND